MRTGFTAGLDSVAASFAHDAAVPTAEAALIGAIAAQLAIVATRWPVAAATAVGSGGTTGKSERAANVSLTAGCSESRNYEAQGQIGSGKDLCKHSFLRVLPPRLVQRGRPSSK